MNREEVNQHKYVALRHIYQAAKKWILKVKKALPPEAEPPLLKSKYEFELNLHIMKMHYFQGSASEHI